MRITLSIDNVALQGPIYCHCAFGHGRSATFAAAWMILKGFAKGSFRHSFLTVELKIDIFYQIHMKQKWWWKAFAPQSISTRSSENNWAISSITSKKKVFNRKFFCDMKWKVKMVPSEALSGDEDVSSSETEKEGVNLLVEVWFKQYVNECKKKVIWFECFISQLELKDTSWIVWKSKILICWELFESEGERG